MGEVLNMADYARLMGGLGSITRELPDLLRHLADEEWPDGTTVGVMPADNGWHINIFIPNEADE